MLSANAIASLLIMERHVPKNELRVLRNPDLRHDVEKRLLECGMRLINDPLAPEYSIRPTEDVRVQLEEVQSGVRLDSAEHTALVLCWAKLIWPAVDAPHDAPKKDHDFTENAFAHEFKDIFGTESYTKRVLSRLHNLSFLQKDSERDAYIAGPALWSNIDHGAMRRFVQQRSVLVHARDRALALKDHRRPAMENMDRMVLELLKGAREPMFLRDVYRELDIDRADAKASLERHRAAGRVRLVDSEKKKFSRWEVVP